MQCKAFDPLRTSYTRALASDCTCEPEEGEEGFQICSTFYAGLDDEGKAVWMLGGPVDGRAPERSVDAAERTFVQEAWKRRNERLEAIFHPAPCRRVRARSSTRGPPQTTGWQ